ncbi:hypothetical protein ACFWCH_05365 [Microbacterium sp. NPDC060132]|uniref:hypothetical protein n=1 Tax=unclassified Microbacterium TaxID=2609290 RepID=UPI0036635A2C
MKVILIARKLSRPKALFGMSEEDAMALCSDPRSKGQRWMTVFAPIEEWQVNGAIPTRAKIEDTGKLDGLIKELGLTKHAI